ncbi:MAG: hypothetical protein AB2693_16030, partial [Candidatus Thiodiazotropha sp.]
MNATVIYCTGLAVLVSLMRSLLQYDLFSDCSRNCDLVRPYRDCFITLQFDAHVHDMYINKPQHDKTNKVTSGPPKTYISHNIHHVPSRLMA